MRIGVISHCLNCGDDIGPLVFPHYCGYCLRMLRESGCLPSGLLEQQKLEDSD